MKVALFIDGKNFYSGLTATSPNTRIDFPAMADWLVEQAGGDMLWGAHYYTGIERGDRAGDDRQQALKTFLDMIELQPGFFVQRFPRKASNFICLNCGHENSFTQEKEVDTTMVADMLRLAAVGAFDIMVLLSGDADLTPAIEGVMSLGKRAMVATWGKAGLAPRLRKSAFGHIDLVNGLSYFSFDDNGEMMMPMEPRDEDDGRAAFLDELHRAEDRLQSGYVGLKFFLTRWKSPTFDLSPEARNRILHQLELDGLVEIYEVGNGDKAIRSLD